MKIIFDSKEQLKSLVNRVCPSSFNGKNNTEGCFNAKITCEQCWESCGIDIEVNSEIKSKDKIELTDTEMLNELVKLYKKMKGDL